MRLGALIRSYRDYAGLSQQDLAVMINVRQPAISFAESGQSVPHDSTLAAMADAIATKLGYVSGDEIYQHFLDAKHAKPSMLPDDDKAIIIADMIRVYPPAIREKIYEMVLSVMRTFNELSGWFKTDN